MATTILIVAYHPAGLTPVFGEPALCRLARLAVSVADKVEVWITPDLSRKMAHDFRQLPKGILPQVLIPEAMPEAARQRSIPPEEKLLVLPGHSVWDRLSLNTLVHSSGAEGDELREYLVSEPEALAATVLRWLGGSQRTLNPVTAPIPWLLKDSSDGMQAESRLVQNLEAATRASDGLLARLVDRRLSRRISPFLARWRVPPNAVTLVSTLTGLLGAWLLAQTGYGLHLLGALLFLTAVVLDGVDGEVARLTLRESRFGHYLDIITDNLVHVAVFVGISLGLYRETHNPWHLYVLVALLLGFGFCALAVWQITEKGGRLPEERRSAADRLVSALNSRDFAYLVVLLALADHLSWFLWGAALGTYVFALAVWLLPRFSRRPSS